MIRICFVCLGNICRSPTAEGVMRHLLESDGRAGEVELDSAGTGSWHVGDAPDPRAQAEARRRGIPLRGTARRFERGDFARFDYVIAMDADNRRDLERLAPDAAAMAKIHMLRSFEPAASDGDLDVPDPYYDGGFERVLDICEAACRGLLEHLSAER